MAGKTCPEQAQLGEGQNTVDERMGMGRRSLPMNGNGADRSLRMNENETQKFMNEWEWATEVYE